jgi:hypothetical protein
VKGLRTASGIWGKRGDGSEGRGVDAFSSLWDMLASLGDGKRIGDTGET